MSETKSVQLSERFTVEIQALTAREVMAANRYLPDGMTPTNGLGFGLAVTQAQSLCAIRKLNDKFINPCTSSLDFDKVADGLNQDELMALGQAYNDLATPPTGDELKNS